MLSSLERARMPIKYMASLFSAGNEEIVNQVYRKLIAVRIYQRSRTVADTNPGEAQRALDLGGITAEEAGAIYRLTALPTYDERFVIPPMGREMSIEQLESPLVHKGDAGFGFREAPERRW